MFLPISASGFWIPPKVLGMLNLNFPVEISAPWNYSQMELPPTQLQMPDPHSDTRRSKGEASILAAGRIQPNRFNFCCLTKHFLILEPEGQTMNEFYVVRKSRSQVFEALKLLGLGLLQLWVI